MIDNWVGCLILIHGVANHDIPIKIFQLILIFYFVLVKFNIRIQGTTLNSSQNCSLISFHLMGIKTVTFLISAILIQQKCFKKINTYGDISIEITQ